MFRCLMDNVAVRCLDLADLALWLAGCRFSSLQVLAADHSSPKDDVPRQGGPSDTRVKSCRGANRFQGTPQLPQYGGSKQKQGGHTLVIRSARDLRPCEISTTENRGLFRYFFALQSVYGALTSFCRRSLF